MADPRPKNCRHRLQDEGSPYPRSSCAACGRTITTGLGRRCHLDPVDHESEIAALQQRVDDLTREVAVDPAMCVHKFGIDARRCLKCGWDFRKGEPPQPTPEPAGLEKAVEAGLSSTTAYSREQLAKLAYVTFYSPVLCGPQNIAAYVNEIDCCPGCDHVSNGGTCSQSERGEYCPSDLAETLRQISDALYGPRDPSHYVASVFGPDKMTAFAALPHLSPSPQAVPEGMVLVPRIPTNEMLAACRAVDLPGPDIYGDFSDDSKERAGDDLYRAMIAASPTDGGRES